MLTLAASLIGVTALVFAVFFFLLRALAYAANDGVLIALWVIAALESPGCAPVIVCFAMFLLNDCYGFVNWRRMMRSQQ